MENEEGIHLEDVYFWEQMKNLIHSSICIYNKKEKMRKIFGIDSEYVKLTEEEAEDMESIFSLEKKEYPVLRIVGDELILAEIWNCEDQDEWILAGPVYPGNMRKEHMQRIARNHRELERLGLLEHSSCEMETFVSGILLMFWKIWGRELEECELWEYNRGQFDKIQEITSRVAQDIFYRQENYGPHNPYDQELRELDSIQRGDTETLRQSIAETYEGEIGMLAKDPLRHHKNVAVGNITLASRAAIKGGISVEESFSMADSFIQQIEELDNIPEVEIVKRKAQNTYAEAVRDGNKTEKAGDGGKSPLVWEVKEYVFSHLHGTIKISDIADHLHVNPDYLSHLFSSQENMTIKQYVLREKIQRSQNLLRYSEYSIRDIAFYLGFSSQSHFTKVFVQIVGIGPGEYRKQFTDREKWKTM